MTSNEVQKKPSCLQRTINIILYPLRYEVFVFILGTIIGILLAVIVVQYNNEVHIYRNKTYQTDLTGDAYFWWLRNKYKLKSVNVEYDIVSYGNDTLQKESSFLYKEIDLICIVATKNDKYAKAVRDTWSKRCNKVIFFGPFTDDSIPVIPIKPVSSWHWLCDALRYVWKKHNDTLQWVLVVSDNTYVLPENLRRYVASFDFSQPYYLGHPMRFWNVEYNLAQSGYALSYGTMEKITQKFNSSDSCVKSGKYWKNEDWYLGKYLTELGIHTRDTRDPLGRARFNAYQFSQLLFEGSISRFGKFFRDSVYKSPQGPHCCSPLAVTFNGVEANKMYLVDYFIYNVKVFFNGGILGNQPYNSSNEDTYYKLPYNISTPKSWPAQFQKYLGF